MTSGTRFDEAGYIAIPGCIWGKEEDGLVTPYSWLGLDFDHFSSVSRLVCCRTHTSRDVTHLPPIFTFFWVGLSDADWCLQSDLIPNSRLQARPRRPAAPRRENRERHQRALRRDGRGTAVGLLSSLAPGSCRALDDGVNNHAPSRREIQKRRKRTKRCQISSKLFMFMRAVGWCKSARAKVAPCR